MQPFVVYNPDKSEKVTLLQLARKNIESWLDFNKEVNINLNEISPALQKKMASFITLTKNSDLRGCVGTLVARDCLYKDVMRNAYLSAFKDNRFSPLTRDELNIIKIEISILTPPQKVNVESEDELLSILTKEFGLLLKFKEYQATFLPSVWEKINSRNYFLSQLKLKAGLEESFYDPQMEFYLYKVIKFAEE
jgi:AmmeMemoRadiSam system protein A